MDSLHRCSLYMLLVCPLLCASAAWMNVTAGQNVTLSCRAPDNNKAIIVVEWRRPDQEPQYVFLYRDETSDPDHQHPSYVNRVDLQDRQMKDGDVSLALKNVTTADTGTYECRVFMRGTNHRKRANLPTDPISTIHLSVAPPAQTGGHTEDRVRRRRVGLLAGLSAFGVIMAVMAACVISKRQKTLAIPPSPPDK